MGAEGRACQKRTLFRGRSHRSAQRCAAERTRPSQPATRGNSSTGALRATRVRNRGKGWPRHLKDTNRQVRVPRPTMCDVVGVFGRLPRTPFAYGGDQEVLRTGLLLVASMTNPGAAARLLSIKHQAGAKGAESAVGTQRNQRAVYVPADGETSKRSRDARATLRSGDSGEPGIGPGAEKVVGGGGVDRTERKRHHFAVSRDTSLDRCVVGTGDSNSSNKWMRWG